MVINACELESIFKSVGPGSFGNTEYDSRNNLVLRTLDVRTTDLSGSVRLYFNNQREQVLSGRRFDPLGSGLVLLRPGSFYRVQSQIEFSEPIPKGVTAKILLNQDVADIIMLTSDTLYEGHVGPVYFTISPFRKVEIEKLTSFGSLMFLKEGPSPLQAATGEGFDDVSVLGGAPDPFKGTTEPSEGMGPKQQKSNRMLNGKKEESTGVKKVSLSGED